MRTRPPRGERIALVAVLRALGVIPLLSGLAGVTLGPSGAPGGAPTTASVDSEYRFVNIFWAAAGPVLWWSLRRPRERAGTTRVVLGLASLGGIPRLLSVARTGWPHPVFRGAIVLELVIMPIVIAWHTRVFAARDR